MTVQKNLIEQLEETITHGDIGRRAETLRRVTDLFVSTTMKYSDEQVELFDEVMCRLIEEIEVSARIALGARLAAVANAPPNVVRDLALDDSIEVAGPILSQSERVDERTLVEGAKSKSQDHLLAISQRKVLPETVTDVLVDRGDHAVALSTAANRGAKFSEFGYSTLVRRSQGHDDLALKIWSRPEVPRQHLLHLFAQASETVRAQFDAADPRKADLIRSMVAQASEQLQADVRSRSPIYAAAREKVRALHAAGRLDEAHVAAFANEARFEEVAIALSLMINLSIGLVERAIVSNRSEQILVIAKAIGLGWDTTKAVLMLKAGVKGSSTNEVDKCFQSYTRLQPDTAKKAINFYRLRERAASAPGSTNSH